MSALQKIVIDDVEVLLGSREVYCGNKAVEMTGLEFNLLWLLMENSPQVVSRECIAQHIFNRSLCQASRSINMHVSTIRRKLLVSAKYSRIKAVRGKGYSFFSAKVIKDKAKLKASEV